MCPWCCLCPWCVCVLGVCVSMVCVCVCVHVHACVHACVHVCPHCVSPFCVCVCVSPLCVCVCVRVRARAQTHAFMHICEHVCAHICVMWHVSGLSLWQHIHLNQTTQLPLINTGSRYSTYCTQCFLLLCCSRGNRACTVGLSAYPFPSTSSTISHPSSLISYAQPSPPPATFLMNGS